MKRMRGGTGTRNKKRSPWRLRLPLVACLGAGLMLIPGNACASAMNPEKPRTEIVEKRGKGPAKRKMIPTRTLIKRLQGKNVKKAIRAAIELSKRQSAIPSLLKTLNHQDRKVGCRALAVLYRMNWKKVSSRQKTKAAKAMFPLLMKFDPTGRSPESKLVESTLLKIGTEAMPAFTELLKSRHSIMRLIGLGALSQVEWSGISPKAAFRVKGSLEKLKEDKIEALRGMAKELIRRINRTYVRCERNRVRRLETGQTEQSSVANGTERRSIGNRERNFGGEDYEEKTA